MAGFEDLSLVELLAKRGLDGLAAVLPPKVFEDSEAIAEMVESNLRRTIIEERPTNPK